jgi:hypothetical protein
VAGVTGFQTLYTGRAVSFQRSIAGLAADIEPPTETLKARIGRERQLNEFVAGLEKRIGPPRHVAPRSILFSNHGPLGAPDPPLTARSDGLFLLPRLVQLRHVRNGETALASVEAGGCITQLARTSEGKIDVGSHPDSCNAANTKVTPLEPPPRWAPLIRRREFVAGLGGAASSRPIVGTRRR